MNRINWIKGQLILSVGVLCFSVLGQSTTPSMWWQSYAIENHGSELLSRISAAKARMAILKNTAGALELVDQSGVNLGTPHIPSNGNFTKQYLMDFFLDLSDEDLWNAALAGKIGSCSLRNMSGVMDPGRFTYSHYLTSTGFDSYPLGTVGAVPGTQYGGAGVCLEGYPGSITEWSCGTSRDSLVLNFTEVSEIIKYAILESDTGGIDLCGLADLASSLSTASPGLQASYTQSSDMISFSYNSSNGQIQCYARMPTSQVTSYGLNILFPASIDLSSVSGDVYMPIEDDVFCKGFYYYLKKKGSSISFVSNSLPLGVSDLAQIVSNPQLGSYATTLAELQDRASTRFQNDSALLTSLASQSAIFEQENSLIRTQLESAGSVSTSLDSPNNTSSN